MASWKNATQKTATEVSDSGACEWPNTAQVPCVSASDGSWIWSYDGFCEGINSGKASGEATSHTVSDATGNGTDSIPNSAGVCETSSGSKASEYSSVSFNYGKGGGVNDGFRAWAGNCVSAVERCDDGFGDGGSEGASQTMSVQTVSIQTVSVQAQSDRSNDSSRSGLKYPFSLHRA